MFSSSYYTPGYLRIGGLYHFFIQCSIRKYHGGSEGRKSIKTVIFYSKNGRRKKSDRLVSSFFVTLKMEEQKRPLFTTRILAALGIALIIFIFAFLLGYVVSFMKYNDVTVYQENMRYKILSYETERELVSEDCNLFSLYTLSIEMENIGTLVSLLEEKIGKLDQRVLEQKKTYSVLEAQHFLFVTDYNKRCNKSINTILFFYSNKGSSKDPAEKIGFILGTLKNQNQDNLMVYSFDYDLDINIINILKEKYGVIEPNTIVINGKQKLVDVKNIKEVLPYMNSSKIVSK